MRRLKPWAVLALMLCPVLLGMWLLPLADTSEPRYAEIARLMAQTGDWITPWFEPGVPFWGKPPLSFWAQAIFFKLAGVSEFSARMPSLLATLATIGLLFVCARSFYGLRVAYRVALIYGSCALAYVATGAVLTDPFLALGTTLSMVSFVMAPREPAPFWRYGFFVGLAIGLLAKGPLVLVLVAGPLLPWLVLNRTNWQAMRALPWGRGVLLALALSLPWYLLAEMKTPGFLNYFVVGEHLMRFIDPGWRGDLYGSAHQRAYGTIWWYWIQAAFPWSILALGMLSVAVFRPLGRTTLRRSLHDPMLTYLLAWSLFTPVFFTVSGNILWTYLLPALGAFSILMAVGLDSLQVGAPRLARRANLLAGLAPAVILIMTLMAVIQPLGVKTERELVAHAQQQMNGKGQFFYVDSRPFSARFYSGGTAGLLTLDQVDPKLKGGKPLLLAVPKDLIKEVEKKMSLPLKEEFQNQRYVLVEVEPQTQWPVARTPAPARPPEE